MYLLDTKALNLGHYNRLYLEVHLAHLDYSLYLNGCVLQHTYNSMFSNPVSICDYGGGTGLLGFLAKESFGCRLIYVDLYPRACQDVKNISQAMSVEIDEIVNGDIKTLVSSKIEPPQFIISRDVIEHIYDLEEFFSMGHRWNTEMIQIHNTSANIYNVFRKSFFRKNHIQNEFFGTKGSVLKETETELSYFDIRKKIIQTEYQHFSESDLHHLTTVTRGMIEAEIKKAAHRFRNSEMIICKEKHPTNTCDPYTGNWAERLLTFDQYKEMAKPSYEVKFFGTFYNRGAKGLLKKYAGRFLNLIISFLGNKGRILWPAVTIFVIPKKAIS